MTGLYGVSTVSPEEIGQVINDRVELLPTLEAGAVRDREAQAAAEAEQRRQMEQEYGDVGSMVGTVAENLAGGATFGGSHMITNALSIYRALRHCPEKTDATGN